MCSSVLYLGYGDNPSHSHSCEAEKILMSLPSVGGHKWYLPIAADPVNKGVTFRTLS